MRVLTVKSWPLAAESGTTTRGVGVITSASRMSLAAVRRDRDPGLGHQQRPIVHLGYGHHMLGLSETNASRDPRGAALRDELKCGDLDERVPWREHADLPYVVGLGH